MGQDDRRYLHLPQLRAVFLLIDIRHEPSVNDQMMYRWILEKGYHPIVIATKLDKIKRSQLQKQLKILRTGLRSAGPNPALFRTDEAGKG